MDEPRNITPRFSVVPLKCLFPQTAVSCCERAGQAALTNQLSSFPTRTTPEAGILKGETRTRGALLGLTGHLSPMCRMCQSGKPPTVSPRVGSQRTSGRKAPEMIFCAFQVLQSFSCAGGVAGGRTQRTLPFQMSFW